MLRASAQILIKKLFEAGKIDQWQKQRCIEFITRDVVHQDLRNLIAMILLPKKLHRNDDSQAAYLKAAVSRVSDYKQNFDLYFRLRTQLYWKSQVL